MALLVTFLAVSDAHRKSDKITNQVEDKMKNQSALIYELVMLPDIHLPFLQLFSCSSSYAHNRECTCDDVSQTHTIPEPDWLETEVVAGFRVWQILFLVCAGLGTLVVVVCCMTRWRIPHTRQEIEANHRRNQITQLFRCHLDRIPVDEVDLLWALDTVKVMVERRKSRKRPSEGAEEPEDELKPKLPLLQRIKNVFVKPPLVEFSDDESKSTSTADNCSL